MFELGPEKLLMLGLIVLVLFGGRRIPEIGSGLGKGIREFKRSLAGADEEAAPPSSRSSTPVPRDEPRSDEVAITVGRDEPRRLIG